jgi:hypothetical protein
MVRSEGRGSKPRRRPERRLRARRVGLINLDARPSSVGTVTSSRRNATVIKAGPDPSITGSRSDAIDIARARRPPTGIIAGLANLEASTSLFEVSHMLRKMRRHASATMDPVMRPGRL